MTKRVIHRKSIKNLKTDLKHMYAQSVNRTKTAQSYLYQAYGRKQRFYKVLQMFERLAFVVVTLFVPFALQRQIKLFIGDGILFVIGIVAMHPFADEWENIMDRFSRLTNIINVSVAIGVTFVR